ncbi:MAG: hypothetical protein K1X71_13875 [Pirellulales bacterium]|nr:hypothetical protein [Pirellulales bacterium]
MSAADSNSALRRGVYLIIASIALGGMLGRILAVNAVDKIEIDKSRTKNGKPLLQRPFLSANDRSRWCTVRALVELGTYQIDEIIAQPNWDTIDMVKRPDDGHLYSSKPPLFPTLMAGEYWIIHRLTGRTLGTHPYEIGRFMLITINVLPLLLYFAIVARWVERYGATDWGRVFAFAAAALATFLTTFVVVINNHLPAAVCVAIATDAVLRIWIDGDQRWRWFFVAGLASSFAAAVELPALSFAALAAAALVWRFPRQTLTGFAPPALVVAIAALATNYAAFGTLTPAYKHKDWYDYSYMKDGRERDSYWRDRQGIDRGEPSQANYALHMLVGHHGIFSLTPIWLLSVAGVATALATHGERLRGMALAIALLSVVCFVFYLLRPLEDRNYGGMTSGLRWSFWLIPLWTLMLLPALEWVAPRAWLRWLACALLVFSTLSVSYPTWNPWTHPWIANFLVYLDWIKF